MQLFKIRDVVVAEMNLDIHHCLWVKQTEYESVWIFINNKSKMLYHHIDPGVVDWTLNLLT